MKPAAFPVYDLIELEEAATVVIDQYEAKGGAAEAVKLVIMIEPERYFRIVKGRPDWRSRTHHMPPVNPDES